MKIKNNGFTMVEVLLAIGIMAVAIIASIIAYNSASSQSKINKEIQFATQLRDNIINAYSIVSGTGEIKTAAVIEQNLVPEQGSRVINGTIRSGFVPRGWTPVIDVWPVRSNNYGDSGSHFFRLQYKHIRDKNCIDLVKAAAPVFDAVFLSSNHHGGVMVKDYQGNIDIEQIIESCNSHESRDTFYISLVTDLGK